MNLKSIFYMHNRSSSLRHRNIHNVAAIDMQFYVVSLTSSYCHISFPHLCSQPHYGAKSSILIQGKSLSVPLVAWYISILYTVLQF